MASVQSLFFLKSGRKKSRNLEPNKNEKKGSQWSSWTLLSTTPASRVSNCLRKNLTEFTSNGDGGVSFSNSVITFSYARTLFQANSIAKLKASLLFRPDGRKKKEVCVFASLTLNCTFFLLLVPSGFREVALLVFFYSQSASPSRFDCLCVLARAVEADCTTSCASGSLIKW